MWQSGWRVGCSNESELSLGSGIFKVDKGICKWRKSVSYSIMDMAIDVCVSDEAVNNSSSAH